MGLRDLAAGHLGMILADANGVGEALVYTPAVGSPVSLFGTWNENPRDARNAIGGVGIEATVSGATCRIRLADVPELDEAATITRVATGEDWTIVQHELSAGVSRILRLAKRAESRVRA